MICFEIYFGSLFWSRSFFSFSFFIVTFLADIYWNPFYHLPLGTSFLCHTTPKHNRSTPMLNNLQGVLFIKWYLLKYSPNIYLWWLWPKSSIFASSIHRTCFQNASGLFICCSTSFRHWLWWWGHWERFHSDDSSMQITVQWCTTTLVAASPCCTSLLSFGNFTLLFCPAQRQFDLTVFFGSQILAWLPQLTLMTFGTVDIVSEKRFDIYSLVGIN